MRQGGNITDLPKHGNRYEFDVQPGDILILYVSTGISMPHRTSDPPRRTVSRTTCRPNTSPSSRPPSLASSPRPPTPISHTQTSLLKKPDYWPMSWSGMDGWPCPARETRGIQRAEKGGRRRSSWKPGKRGTNSKGGKWTSECYLGLMLELDLVMELLS
jgi:hypothetical protein